MNESAFQSRVIDYARLMGWRVAHHRPARTAKGWRTPVEGHPGFPDLVLARNGVVICAELKSERGRLSVDQRAWLHALDGHGRLWRPSDWLSIQHELGR